MTFISKFDLGSVVGYTSKDQRRIATVTGVFFTVEGVLYEIDGIDEGNLLEENRIEDFYVLGDEQTLSSIQAQLPVDIDELEGVAHV